MTPGIIILGIGADASNIGWLTDGLAEYETLGWSVQYRSVENVLDQLAEGPLAASAIILDSSIGLNEAGMLLSSHQLRASSKPVLIGAAELHDTGWDHLIRQGAQDFLFKDRDSGPEIKRTISRAIDRARILEATQEAEIRLRTIIENIDDGVLIVDQDGIVLFANPAVEDQLDLSLHDLYGIEVPFEIPARADEYLPLERPGRNRVTFHVRTYSIRWEGRESRLITLRDVTAEQEISEQLRFARKAAEEASAMKSAFLANMSHELRMPLASIIGFAQLIEEGTENADFREFSQTIQSSGNRLLSTINAVLEATRLDKHHIDPHLSGVQVDVLIEAVAQSLQPLIVSDAVTIVFEGEDNTVAKTDEDFLVRILNNLIGNAIKFTETGTIALRWGYDGDYVRIDIQDTGAGMAPDFLPHAFEEFAQESTGASRSHEGSGLGLTIVKGLLDLLDGKIEIESEKDVGTRISVYIPRADQ